MTEPQHPILRNIKNGWAQEAHVVPRLKGGDGHDIIIRIDGTYFDAQEAEAMRWYWNRELKTLIQQLNEE